MSKGYLFHNATQNKLNVTEIIDFVDSYNVGDLVYRSEVGSACLEIITDAEMQKYIEEVDEWHKQQEQLMNPEHDYQSLPNEF